jgi:hypothetical protein
VRREGGGRLEGGWREGGGRVEGGWREHDEDVIGSRRLKYYSAPAAPPPGAALAPGVNANFMDKGEANLETMSRLQISSGAEIVLRKIRLF